MKHTLLTLVAVGVLASTGMVSDSNAAERRMAISGGEITPTRTVSTARGNIAIAETG